MAQPKTTAAARDQRAALFGSRGRTGRQSEDVEAQLAAATAAGAMEDQNEELLTQLHSKVKQLKGEAHGVQDDVTRSVSLVDRLNADTDKALGMVKGTASRLRLVSKTQHGRLVMAFMLCAVLGFVLFCLERIPKVRGDDIDPHQATAAGLAQLDSLSRQASKMGDAARFTTHAAAFTSFSAAGDANATAALCLGRYFLGGKGGVTGDDTKALHWFMHASSLQQKMRDDRNRQPILTCKGGASAPAHVARMCAENRVPASEKLAAVGVVEQSATAGDLDSAHLLGIMNIHKGCMPKDDPRGLQWVRRAAEGGHGPAMTEWALMHMQGAPKPLERSLQKAVHWLIGSATVQDAGGAYILSRMLEKGNGLDRSHAKSEFWLHRAADYGSDEARQDLYNLYNEGSIATTGLAKMTEGRQGRKHPKKAAHWLTQMESAKAEL